MFDEPDITDKEDRENELWLRKLLASLSEAMEMTTEEYERVWKRIKQRAFELEADASKGYGSEDK